MKKILFACLSFLSFSIVAQEAPVYDDMIIEMDSVTSVYKPSSKNYIFMKSKRGADGVPKTSSADSILALNLPITDIVLVYTEDNAGDLAKRETANRERWENLAKTYPQFFQFETNYKSLCQCNYSGDQAAFKLAQGFYIYFPGKEPPKPAAPKVAEKKTETPKAEEKPAKEEKAKKEKKEEVAKEEKPKKEKKKKEEEVVVKEEPAPVVEEPIVAKQKKQGYATPKKAKDAKQCRPPCYDGGDEGLNNFLKETIPLSKKQKRHSGDLEATVTLMLHFDGSIKKHIVICADEEFKKQVEESIKMMDLWNPMVKGGVTTKSQVKLVLRYDSGSKQIKPFETTIIPRPAPKCTECLSDSDIGIQ
jgi:hypothetical protein